MVPPAYPYSSLVAVDAGDGQPCGQIQHVLQDLLIQLQVGQLALSLQCAQVDLIWGEVLREPTQDQSTEWLDCLRVMSQTRVHHK